MDYVRVVHISRFSCIGICELKAYLGLVMGYKPEFREEVWKGIKQHKISADIDALKGYKPISPSELLAQLRNPRTCIELPNESIRVGFIYGGMRFCGRLDKLLKLGDRVVVVDEKFVTQERKQMGLHHRYQLGAYCYGLKFGRVFWKKDTKFVEIGREIFSKNTLYMRIVERDINTRKVLGEIEERFKPEEVENALSRFIKILREEVEPKTCDEPSICATCEYAYCCPHAIRMKKL
ncbi:MAG: PD-(D/E)XK nuclease family protein [Candidatus Micrarchaeia archaeon]